jgi:hypothetical protein
MQHFMFLNVYTLNGNKKADDNLKKIIFINSLWKPLKV